MKVERNCTPLLSCCTKYFINRLFYVLCFFQNEWNIVIWFFGCIFLFSFIDTKYAINDSCMPRENKMFVSWRGQSRWLAPTIKTQHTQWSLNYLVIEKRKYGISNQLIKRTIMWVLWMITWFTFIPTILKSYNIFKLSFHQHVKIVNLLK